MGNCSAGPHDGCCSSSIPKANGKAQSPLLPGANNGYELNGNAPQDMVGIKDAEFPDFKDVNNNGGNGDEPRRPIAGTNGEGGDGLKDDSSKTVLYGDSSTYTGQMVNGKRQGHGLWQSRGGQYDGQWQHDIQHGFGKQRWSDGRLYEGYFEDGKFSGRGKMVWTTPRGEMTYEGDYKDDVKHGKGKFTWADGRVYDGEWDKGKRHGRGHYTNNKEEPRVGYWKEDKFERWEADGDP
mmetsp:Transcript_1732/g.4435  ORF Transcript_1732/g.4435 Transcript_1732/m.4435 type:complete len:237 (-) Transcript_1732:145-855(-)